MYQIAMKLIKKKIQYIHHMRHSSTIWQKASIQYIQGQSKAQAN